MAEDDIKSDSPQTKQLRAHSNLRLCHTQQWPPAGMQDGNHNQQTNSVDVSSDGQTGKIVMHSTGYDGINENGSEARNYLDKKTTQTVDMTEETGEYQQEGTTTPNVMGAKSIPIPTKKSAISKIEVAEAQKTFAAACFSEPSM